MTYTSSSYCPSKHAGSNSEAFWLRPACSQDRASSHRCQIWLHTSDSVPFFQRRPGSDWDDLVRFWPTASGPEANQCASIILPGSDRTQRARYQFPAFRLRCILPQTDSLDHIVQNSLGLIWLWLTVRSGLNRSGPETSLCARITESTSRQSFWANPDQM